MLELSQVDLSSLCEALEDHSDDHYWWFDPNTGEVESRLDSSEEEDDEALESRGLIPIQPIPSSESYRDLVDFTSQVRDSRARDFLERAIAGRGAFRRFKDTLFEFPGLREGWFKFHDARMEWRALEWLADEGLIDAEVAERERLARSDLELPELSDSFDPFRLAKEVEEDLRRLYGSRFHRLLLFGSWARGDAHPESDIDLLVVLDRVDSPWDELRRMDQILWRHSLENGTVITAVPVGRFEFDRSDRPMIVRARAEGRVVA